MGNRKNKTRGIYATMWNMGPLFNTMRGFSILYSCDSYRCFLSLLGVFLVTRNREKEHLPQSYVDLGNIPGKTVFFHL